ncbi:MAPEG family protein [uncultured Erythrobacter sp.]|uniref:MAPEG family protein n=1 Tax=uncultured Erythrobacter sp. TaxID=263913 RepID=UPI002627129B|nr:MAPEG family protein [uncultured Erythrobacter sp.]
MPLPITSATTALLALLLLTLAILTVRHRFRLKVGFGDAGDGGLIAASRSHGNLAEHAPIVLIMLGLLEYGGANAQLLMGLAGAFVIGRVAHAIGLHGKDEPGKPPLMRQAGVILTWLVMLVLIVMLLLGVFARS